MRSFKVDDKITKNFVRRMGLVSGLTNEQIRIILECSNKIN